MSAIFLILLFATLVAPKTEVVGPGKWLKTLSEAEKLEIYKKCTTSSDGGSRAGSADSSGNPGFIVQIVQENDVLCIGALITPRHAITSRQCFLEANKTVSLRIGRSCPATSPHVCEKQTLIDLPLHFAIYDDNTKLSAEGDIAIIQLVENIPNKLISSGQVEFVCLPESMSAPIPSRMKLASWEDSDQLSVVGVETKLVGSEQAIKDGGAIAFYRKQNQFMIYGLISDGSKAVLKITDYLDDICYWIGLCGVGVDGLYPKLVMSSIYLQDINQLESLPPFRPISETANRKMINICGSDDNNMRDANSSFTAVIVNENTEVLCNAVFVTNHHLIAAKECVLEKMDGLEHLNGISVLRVFVNEDKSFIIEFIAWSTAHPFALVQLKDYQDEHMATIDPVCVDDKSKEALKAFKGSSRSYEVISQMVISGLPEELKSSCQDVKHICAGSSTNQLSNDYAHDDFVVFQPSTSRLVVGVHVKTEYTGDRNISLFINMQHIAGALCLYTRLCPSETHAMNNAMPYFTNFYYSSTTVVSPRNWLKKLTEAENAEINAKCSPSHDRAGGAVRVEYGRYPFAAATNAPRKGIGTGCEATLISQWHLLTAKHCFEDKDWAEALWIGGMFLYRGNKTFPDVDMVELKLDFVLFDSIGSIFKTIADMAIVQLKERVPEHLFASGKVDIACLPKDSEIPNNIELAGWGFRNLDSSDELHLTPANLSVVVCYYDRHIFPFICAISANESNKNIGILPGDSGSGGVAYSDAIQRFVIYGVASWYGTNGYDWIYSVFVKTNHFLEDFCFLLGLCRGAQIKSLEPKLGFGGLYLYSGNRYDYTALAPFRLIEENTRKKILADCKAFRAGKLTRDVCEMELIQPSTLVTAMGDVLCSASMMTPNHFIVSRDCIVRNLKSIKSAGVKMGNVTQHVELIAWSYTHHVAIVQLRADIDFPSHSPICFDETKKYRERKRRANYQSLTNVFKDLRQEIIDSSAITVEVCSIDEHFCVEKIEECPSAADYPTNQLDDFLIVSAYDWTVAGLKVENEWAKQNNFSLYVKPHVVLGALCIYLNRCDTEQFNFNSVMQDFTSIFYA